MRSAREGSMGAFVAAMHQNGQRDLPALEVIAELMREEALEIMAAFPWSESAPIVDPRTAARDG